MRVVNSRIFTDHSFRELTAHGSADFPCMAYDKYLTSENGLEDLAPWHCHEECEVMYAREPLQVATPGKIHDLGAGDCIAFNCNVLHAARSDHMARSWSIVFRPRLITGGRESAMHKKFMGPLIASQAFEAQLFRKEERETRCFLKALDALLNESYGFEFTARAALSEIALSLCGRYLGEEGQVSGTREARERERLKLMLTYIDAHYTEGLSVEEIAAVAHIGKRECQRCFQKTLGMTPLQYALRCRVMAGADLLVNEPALSVGEVAAHCGFDSLSHFGDLFKRYYVRTPREYRRWRLSGGKRAQDQGYATP